MNSPIFKANLETFLDWNSLNETRTELLLEDIQTAAKFSQSIRWSEQRWQVYLWALGVVGFKKWLKERAPDLAIIDDALNWQPALANILGIGGNLQVGDFKIGLVVANNIFHTHPASLGLFDVANLAAHFYVLVQVMEEEEQVAIVGFMSYAQYQCYQQIVQLKPGADWTYSLPHDWFNGDAEALLLNLRCLEPTAVHLPVVSTAVDVDVLVALKQKLKNLQSQLKTQTICNLITASEGVILLNNQHLINYLEQLQTKTMAKSSINLHQSSVGKSLININNWLQDQVDTVTEELGWMLMPSLSLSQMRLRDSQDNFDLVQASLKKQGINVPSSARGAYVGIDAKNGSLRLYAIAWVLPDTAENPGWVLLTILAPQPGATMPEKLRLEVCDESGVLFDETLDDTSLGMLYAQVMGDMQEKFWVTVTADEVVFEMPGLGME